MGLDSYLSNPYVLAGLDVLSFTEGANYNTLFGGGTFSDFSRHPSRLIKAGKYTSDAAGRYQFLNVSAPHTWASLVRQYGLADFSPHSQDIGALALISQAGGLNALAAGDLQTFVGKVRGIWPSLPGGRQQTRGWSEVTSYWQNDLAARGSGSGSTGGSNGGGQGPGLTPGDVLDTGAGDSVSGDDSGGVGGVLWLAGLAAAAALAVWALSD